MGTGVREQTEGQQWLTAAQAAKRAGMSPWLLYQHAKDGSLTAYRPGGKGTYRFRAEDIDALMQPVERPAREA